MMRGRARLHPDQAATQLLKKRQYLTPNDNRSFSIDAMDLEHRRARSTPIVMQRRFVQGSSVPAPDDAG
jgi:hypothetical protein